MLTFFFINIFRAFIALLLIGKCATQSWGGAHSSSASDALEVSTFDYQQIGLSVTTSDTPFDDPKVYILVTANFRSTSSTDKVRFGIFRNGDPLYPLDMYSVDATNANEQYSVTFTFIDTPGTANGQTYTVMARGTGVISFDNTLRSLFCTMLMMNYPVAGVIASDSLFINNLVPTSLATTSYTSGAVTGGHLIGATSVYDAFESDLTKTGYFSLTRDGTDLSDGTGFTFPSTHIAHRKRTASILFFEAPDDPVTSYASTARLANEGDPQYAVGSEAGEARTLTAVAMPPGMGYATTSTSRFITSYSEWTDMGLSVTVPGVLQASMVLVTVNTFVRHTADGIGRFTIFRDGVNLGDVFNGMQTVAFAGGIAGVQHREATFFFVDELVPSSAQVTYTVMFRVEPGSVGTMTVGQSGVKSQIAAIVVEGIGGGGDSEDARPTTEPSAFLASQPSSNPVASHMGSHMGVLSTPTNPPTTSGSNLGLPHSTTATSAVTLPGGTTYTSIGLSLSPVITTSTDKVFLLATLNWQATAHTDRLEVNFFRNGVQLAPVALAAADASRANEHYPITIAFRDMPGATGAFTYEVRVAGSGVISQNGNPRTLLAFIVAAAHPATAVYTSGALSITSATATSLGMTATVSLAAITPVLLISSSTHTGFGAPASLYYGTFTFARNGVNLDNGLSYPSNNVAHKRRPVLMCYLHVDAPAGTGSYTVTARKGNSGTNTFTVGSGGETRNLVALPLPAGKSYVGLSTGNADVSIHWTSVGLAVTVPADVSAIRVLVNVHVNARSSGSTPTATGHYTIFRNGINLGDPSVGLQTVAFVTASPDEENRDVAFFFQDFPPADGSSLVYTVRARTSSGLILSSATSQIGASVLDAILPPTSAPTSAPTPLSPDLAFFMTSPTYTAAPGFAFAARNPTTGAAWTWGQLSATSSTLNVATTMQASGTSALVGNRAAFAFTKSDGSLAAFGVSALIDRHTAYAAASSVNLVGSLVSNDAAFAGIQSGTGRVIAFGSYYNGGDVSTNARCNGYATQLSSGVVSIVASSAAFAAVKSDGSVYAWGNKFAGGGVSTETRPDLVGVTKVFATASAFAALLASGAVKTWGDAFGGGDSSAVSSALSSGVVHIVGSHSVFVAYNSDTSIVVWGNPEYGGSVTSSVVPALTSGVKYVSFTGTALAALKTDGTVRAWGSAESGGDTSAVPVALTNIAKLYSNRFAFAALTAAGGVVAWGDEKNGGLIPSNLASVLSSGVTAIFSTHRAFAALKGATGQLVLWGNPFHGGDAGAAVDYLNSGVRTVCANDAAFTAILQDGRAVAWGHPSSIPTPGLLQETPSFAAVDTCATGAVRTGL